MIFVMAFLVQKYHEQPSNPFFLIFPQKKLKGTVRVISMPDAQRYPSLSDKV